MSKRETASWAMNPDAIKAASDWHRNNPQAAPTLDDEVFFALNEAMTEQGRSNWLAAWHQPFQMDDPRNVSYFVNKARQQMIVELYATAWLRRRCEEHADEIASRSGEHGPGPHHPV